MSRQLLALSPPVAVLSTLETLARHLVHGVSTAALSRACQLEVSGRGNIPWNQNAIITANHVSHLDAGVVCLALGRYARGARIAAAADYFFDSPLKAAFFRHLSDLVPIRRSGSREDALYETERELRRGRSLLIFPEGSRNPTGVMRKFRAGVGYLALSTRTGVLPVWHVGTLNALPKGRLLPRRTSVTVRIGRFLPASLWQKRLEHVAPVEGARIVAALAERAVLELARGQVLSDPERVLAELMHEQQSNVSHGNGNGSVALSHIRAETGR